MPTAVAPFFGWFALPPSKCRLVFIPHVQPVWIGWAISSAQPTRHAPVLARGVCGLCHLGADTVELGLLGSGCIILRSLWSCWQGIQLWASRLGQSLCYFVPALLGVWGLRGLPPSL